jgi:dipeptidyl aminopeptidase/acylaminoacyl peptidase
MEGYDTDPVYSPDGNFIAFHSMERAGFESDRNRIMLFDRGSQTIRELTEGLDQTTHNVAWLPDSSGVVFMSEHRGTNQLFRLGLRDSTVTQITRGAFNWGLRDVLPNGAALLVDSQSMLRPLELERLSLEDGSAQRLTHINDGLLGGLELPRVSEQWVRASDGEMIHCWVIYPPDFDPNRKWPVITYCQGGPQGQIGQWFSYRWSFHLMAARGYVVMAPNRRGLPGFGQAWNDQISGDWGGQAMQDILAATDAMMTRPYADTQRMAAVGASFGGYTVYWLMGQHQDRFRCMVSHCGVFNLESMYGSTEELFFPNWDLGGPYWSSADLQEQYDRFSPHRFVGNWRTPLLVIHGEKDFRVPITQGMEAFTAAQVHGIPSRFLYFPEEGHWVLGPQNGVLWHRIFFDWLDRYCQPR